MLLFERSGKVGDDVLFRLKITDGKRGQIVVVEFFDCTVEQSSIEPNTVVIIYTGHQEHVTQASLVHE